MFKIVVDADSCPVKSEVFRVAERYGIAVTLVANQPGRSAKPDWIIEVVVAGHLDAADDWIVENVGGEDIVFSADIPLAARCLKKGSRVLGPKGLVFTHLRDIGLPTDGTAPFDKRNRSRFLQALDKLVQDTLKGKIER
jgi:uncharacterized protein YaiI (UPF0178 family)